MFGRAKLTRITVFVENHTSGAERPLEPRCRRDARGFWPRPRSGLLGAILEPRDSLHSQPGQPLRCGPAGDRASVAATVAVMAGQREPAGLPADEEVEDRDQHEDDRRATHVELDREISFKRGDVGAQRGDEGYLSSRHGEKPIRRRVGSWTSLLIA